MKLLSRTCITRFPNSHYCLRFVCYSSSLLHRQALAQVESRPDFTQLELLEVLLASLQLYLIHLVLHPYWEHLPHWANLESPPAQLCCGLTSYQTSSQIQRRCRHANFCGTELRSPQRHSMLLVRAKGNELHASEIVRWLDAHPLPPKHQQEFLKESPERRECRRCLDWEHSHLLPEINLPFLMEQSRECSLVNCSSPFTSN